MGWVILIIIGIIIVWTIIKFASDYKKQADYVVGQGGMRGKYKTLVDYFLSGDPRARIVRETSTWIDVRLSTSGGTTTFYITQTFGKVTIQWEVNSPFYGKHKLEWTFDESFDQEKMIEKIEYDVQNYTDNLLNIFM